LPNGASGGASFAATSLLGNNDEKISGLVMLGAAILDEEAEAALCTCTTGKGGLGTRGITTFGASNRNGNASGCNSGSIITTLTITPCKPIDANVVHRLLEET
jgi:hypothetical protein